MTKARDKKRRALSQFRGGVKGQGAPELVKWLSAAADVHNDDPRLLTHGFHAWPARMHPMTVRRALKQAAPGWIVDPFMGGGTVAVEALLGGRPCLGRDLNPVAREVAWARTRIWGAARRSEFMEGARDVAEKARKFRPPHRRVPADFFETEGAWYDPPALVDLWCVLQQLDRRAPNETTRMLRVVLSSVAVKASRQASDSITRVDREHRFVPGGRLLEWFVARAEEHARNLAALSKAAPERHEQPRLEISDARAGLELPPGSVGMVCTSPPYPGTYDYVEHHRRRYVIVGADASAFERRELGSRREQLKHGHQAAAATYRDDMRDVFRAWSGTLHPDAKIVLVVGDGQHRGGGVVPVVPLIEAAAADSGLRVVGRVKQSRSLRGHTARAGSGKRHRATKSEFILCLENA